MPEAERQTGADDGRVRPAPDERRRPRLQSEPPPGADVRVWLQANEAAVAARTLRDEGNTRKARKQLERAVALFVHAGDPRQVIACQGGLGELAAREGRLPEAIEIFERACADARAERQADLEAISLIHAAAAYRTLGTSDIAAAYERRALAVHPALDAAAPPDPPPQDPAADVTTAMRTAADSLLLVADDPQQRLFAEWVRGEAAKQSDDFAGAGAAFAQAIAQGAVMAEARMTPHDHRILWSAILGQAECRIHLKQAGAALEGLEDFFRRVQRPAVSRGGTPDRLEAYETEFHYARARNLSGEALYQLGRMEDAQIELEDALDVCRRWEGLPVTRAKLNDMANATGTCALSLGKLLVDTHRPVQALETLKLSLSCFALTGHENGRASAYLDIANALAAIGKWEDDAAGGPRRPKAPDRHVMEAFDAARTIYETIGNRPGLAAIKGATATFLLENGWSAQALDWFREAARLHRELDLPGPLILDRLREAHICRRLDRLEAAREALDDARRTASEAGWSHLGSQVAASQGDLELAVGDIEAAHERFAEAVALIEVQRSLLVTNERKLDFFLDKELVYARLVRVQLMQERPDLALMTVERSRSRALLDLMRDTRLCPPPAVPAAWRAAEARLLDEARRAEQALAEASTLGRNEDSASRPSDPDRRLLYQSARQARQTLDRHLADIADIAPEYVSLRRGEPAPYDVAADLAFAGRRVVLVEFFVSEAEVHLFCLSPHARHPEATTLPFDAAAFERVVRLGFGGSDLDAGGIEEAWQAHAYLVEPLSRWTRDDDIICLIPHGPLHGMPLHALKVDERCMIERNPVVYAPSASVLRFCTARRGPDPAVPGAAVAAFGDSRGDLPHARDEARRVADLFGTRPVLGSAVDRAAFAEACDGADLIHFAGHGAFNPDDPLNSGLALAAGETFTARDIFGLPGGLKARLVVLSGCETGASGCRTGDELVGLMRALLFAGTPRLVMSLWQVDDEATAFFMTQFYDVLRAGRRDTATVDALRHAMLATKSAYPLMERWAPFMLVGDWS